MDPERLQSLFEQLSGPLVLYARGWCQLPDDAVQEAFIDLASCEQEPVSVKAWLYMTTRRKAQNITRSEGRRSRRQQQAAQQRAAEWFDAARSSSDIAPAEVVRALEHMPTQQREIVVARVWGDLGFEQLAELLGCSLSSAHRRYTKALNHMRKLLEQPTADRAAKTSEPAPGQPNGSAANRLPPTISRAVPQPAAPPHNPTAPVSKGDFL
jgi:RNA polymerase sigma factor (sigma-70 family)